MNFELVSRQEQVATELASHEELAYVAATTGPTNLAAVALFPDLAQLHHYLTQRLGIIQAIGSIETSSVLEPSKLAPRSDRRRQQRPSPGNDLKEQEREGYWPPDSSPTSGSKRWPTGRSDRLEPEYHGPILPGCHGFRVCPYAVASLQACEDAPRGDGPQGTVGPR